MIIARNMDISAIPAHYGVSSALSCGYYMPKSHMLLQALFIVCTANRFLRDVQKGATLTDGGTGGVPQRNFIPFLKRKGTKGMVGKLIKTFVELNKNFCTKPLKAR